MAKTKKWSEQVLIEKPFETQDENGNEVIANENVLEVCDRGMELYKKEFKDDKYKGKNQLLVPYDFMVLAGSGCPKGEFYELEYQIGGSGMVYRALIQCWNAVTDIRLALGCLKRNNILPDGFVARRAWKRGDIDKVSMVGCYKDEEGAVLIGHGFYYPVSSYFIKEKREEKLGLYDYGTMYDSEHEDFADNHICLDYYRGDVKEVWACAADKDLIDPIFVCGSDNVNDPCFAAKRKEDMEEMMSHIDEVISIADDYNLPRIIFVEHDMDEKGRPVGTLSCNIRTDSLKVLFEAIINYKS